MSFVEGWGEGGEEEPGREGRKSEPKKQLKRRERDWGF